MYLKHLLRLSAALALVLSLALCAAAAETTAPTQQTTEPGETVAQTEPSTVPTEQTVEQTEPVHIREEPRKVSVAFLCQPGDLTLTVFTDPEDAASIQEPKGEDPRIYSLLPGQYLYTAVCDGYVPVLDGVLEVPESADPLLVDITLEVMEEQTLPAYYTITFDPCGGVCSVETAVVEPGGCIGPLPVPSREGYAFVGWYEGECYCDPFREDSKVDRDQALLAHWAKTKNTGLAVTFDPNGGELPQALFTAQAQQVNSGSFLSVYDWSGASVSAKDSRVTMAVAADGRAVGAELTVPEGGLLLDGRTDPITGRPTEGTAFVTAIPDGAYIGFDYSSWTICVYDSRDGLLANHSFVEQGNPYGPLPVPTREGYTFAGWYTAPLGGAPVAEETVYTGDTAPVLYAHWKRECTHVYTSRRQEATCQNPLTIRYTCSKCGDCFNVCVGGSWSDWSVSQPWGVPEGLLETREEYRFQCRQITTSEQSSLPGWLLYATERVWGDYGPWSGWSLTPVDSSDAVQVETTLLYRYSCFQCVRCGTRNPYPGACGCDPNGSVWQETWLPIAYDQCGSLSVPGSDASRVTTRLGDGRRWYFAAGNLTDTALGTREPIGESVVIRLGFRQRTRSKTTAYHLERWSDWSGWSVECPADTENIRTERRTVYRQYTGPLGEHIYEDGKCTVCAQKQPA